jgi:hypothetical protein
LPPLWLISRRYYIQQAEALLSWASATRDEAKAARLHAQEAEELERANKQGKPADLDPLLSEFNDEHMLNKGGGKPEQRQAGPSTTARATRSRSASSRAPIAM